MPPAAPSPAAGGAAVVTNYHVVRGADDLRVTLPSGAELTAKLVGQGADRGTAALELASSRTGPCAVRWSTARGRGGAAAAWRGAHGRSNGERARACEPIHAREPGRENGADHAHSLVRSRLPPRKSSHRNAPPCRPLLSVAAGRAPDAGTLKSGRDRARTPRARGGRHEGLFHALPLCRIGRHMSLAGRIGAASRPHRGRHCVAAATAR